VEDDCHVDGGRRQDGRSSLPLFPLQITFDCGRWYCFPPKGSKAGDFGISSTVSTERLLAQSSTYVKDVILLGILL
jgi:hypothetical protein